MAAPVVNPADLEDFLNGFDDQDAAFPDDAASEYSTDSDSSKTVDQDTQLLADLQSSLTSLTLEAETILSHQHRHTQVVLSMETKSLFKQYEQYGSMARLKVGVEKFLSRGDNGGKLRIKDETKKDPDDETLLRKRPAHYGEVFMLNGTAEDDKQKYDATTAYITPLVRDPFDPDPDSFISHPLRTIDPDSTPYVTTLAWDPIATRLTWNAHLAWPRGLLSSINKILTLVDAEARTRLFHHVTKWGPSPVFRLGISQHIKSQYSSIFDTASEHYLGLTPETRSFLRDIYFEKRCINIAERRLLAQACRVHDDSVQIFWEDMSKRLKGYEAMRIFMAARETEKNREASKRDEELRKRKRREQTKKEQEASFMALREGRADPNNLAFFQVDGKVHG